MRYAAPAFLLLLAATAPALPNGARLEQRQRAQVEAADEILTYTTKPGDTLKALAKQWFVRPEDWRLAQALNKLPDPDAIPAGTVIRLRSSWIRTTPISAELVAFRGDVRIVSGEGTVRPGEKGLALGEGDLIETGANGFATLVLPDGSRVSLPSASRVRLTRLRQVPMSDSIDRRFTLEQGRTEAKVTPMANPASRFLITTPVAVAAVRGTEYSVSFTPAEMRQLTQVTEGKVGVRSLRGGPEVLVLAGFGVVADANGVGRPTRLLPGPQMKAPRRIQNGETVTFEFDAVPNAKGYRVEIATDRAFADRVASLDTGETRVSFTDIPNGQLFVRVFALDGNGLPGQPAAFDFTRQYAGGTAAARSGNRGGDDSRGQGGDGGEEGSRDEGDIDWAALAADTTRFLFAGPPTGGPLGGGLPGFGSVGDLLAELMAELGGGTGLPAGPVTGSNFGGGNGGGGNGGTGGGFSGGFGGGGTGGGGFGGGNGSTGGGTGGGSGTGGGTGGNGTGGGTGGGNGGGTGGGGTGGSDGGSPGGGPVVIPGEPGIPGQPGGGELPGDGSSGGLPGGPGSEIPGGLPGGGENPGNGNPGNGNPGGGNPGDGPVVIPGEPGFPGQPGGPGAPGDGLPGGGTPGDGVPGNGTPDNGGIPGGGLPGGGAAAVPEPATWLFLLSGFGLVGLALRRRQRAARA